MILRVALIAALASTILPGSATAQQQPSNAQLVKEFRDGFEKGCRQGKTPDVKNQGLLRLHGQQLPSPLLRS